MFVSSKTFTISSELASPLFVDSFAAHQNVPHSHIRQLTKQEVQATPSYKTEVKVVGEKNSHKKPLFAASSALVLERCRIKGTNPSRPQETLQNLNMDKRDSGYAQHS